MMEWVVVLKISRARDLPIPDEQPVTFVLVGLCFRGFGGNEKGAY